MASRIAGTLRRLKQAAKEDLDLLLLGSRGYGPMRRVLLWGVSDKLLRIAPCPEVSARA